MAEGMHIFFIPPTSCRSTQVKFHFPVQCEKFLKQRELQADACDGQPIWPFTIDRVYYYDLTNSHLPKSIKLHFNTIIITQHELMKWL